LRRLATWDYDVRVVAKEERGQPAFGRYLKETRNELGLSLRRVEALTDGRVRNAFLSQIENGQVALPNVELLGDLSQVYGLDFWNLMWRAGYRIPRQEYRFQEEEEGWTRVPIQRLKDLSDEELNEVLRYSDFVRQRRDRPRARKS
jgi:transcriptional regulator with XRE-family HTH domain